LPAASFEWVQLIGFIQAKTSDYFTSKFIGYENEIEINADSFGSFHVDPVGLYET
jgi:hypothetical protein